VTACGWLAGINTIRPAGTVNGVPAIVMSASPSQDVRDRVERRCVLAQRLAFLKRE
jgi:hypothetical protein